MKRQRRSFHVEQSSNFSIAPDEEKKERLLLLNSVQAVANTARNGFVFQLPEAMKDTIEVTVSAVTFFNTFYNITGNGIDGAGNTLFCAEAGGNVTITFTEGFWQSGLGTVTLAEAIDVAVSGSYLNDVRYHILRSSAGSDVTIDSVTLNPTNNQLEIVFAQSGTSTWISMTDNTGKLGFPQEDPPVAVPGLDLGPVTLTGSNSVDLTTTNILQLCSPQLSRGVHLGSDLRTRDAFAIVPVSAGFGYRERYQPVNPITVKHPSPLRPIKRLEIQFRDEDGELQAMRMKWLLVLKLKSI